MDLVGEGCAVIAPAAMVFTLLAGIAYLPLARRVLRLLNRAMEKAHLYVKEG